MTVSVAAGTGYAVARGSATVTIVDNDSAVLPTVQVADCVARSEADFGLIHQPEARGLVVFERRTELFNA